MKFDRRQIIGGMPIKDVRDLLRELRSEQRGNIIRTRKDIDKTAGRKITDALVAEQLIELYTPPSAAQIRRMPLKSEARWNAEEERKRYSDGGPYYIITKKGISLTAAKMLKRISRARAEQYIAELLERAKRINADPDLLCHVSCIWVYGSYLKPDEVDYGDIDLIADIIWKPEKCDAEANIARMRSLNRSYSDYMGFGSHEVRVLLRGRCPYLSFYWYFSDEIKRTRPKPVEIYRLPEEIVERLLQERAAAFEHRAARRAAFAGK